MSGLKCKKYKVMSGLKCKKYKVMSGLKCKKYKDKQNNEVYLLFYKGLGIIF